MGDKKMTSTQNNIENNYDELDLNYVKCSSNNFDSAYHLNGYNKSNQPSFEGWFEEDKLVRIKVDGQIIDFGKKKSIFDLIDKAVGKLVDLKYKFN